MFFSWKVFNKFNMLDLLNTLPFPQGLSQMTCAACVSIKQECDELFYNLQKHSAQGPFQQALRRQKGIGSLFHRNQVCIVRFGLRRVVPVYLDVLPFIFQSVILQ